MKNGYMKYWLLLAFSTVFLFACKSEFERIRTSNDPVAILEKANEFYENEEWLRAQTLYDVVIPYYRGKVEAEDLFFKYAYTYYNLEDYILSAHYFKSFANSFINSSKREEAAFMSAYSEYQMSPIPELDQTYTQKAIESLQLFINRYPNSERVATCNRLIDELRLKLEEKAFNQGVLYFNIRQYVSAVTSFQNMLKDFPETQKAEEVYFYILRSSFSYAKNSVLEKREERMKETLEHYNLFKKKFPKSKYRKKALQIKKETEKSLKEIANGKGYKS
jgi:outer membrane protein assembly factor BamD